jgi:hypothetical protein
MHRTDRIAVTSSDSVTYQFKRNVSTSNIYAVTPGFVQAGLDESQGRDLVLNNPVQMGQRTVISFSAPRVVQEQGDLPDIPPMTLQTFTIVITHAKLQLPIQGNAVLDSGLTIVIHEQGKDDQQTFRLQFYPVDPSVRTIDYPGVFYTEYLASSSITSSNSPIAAGDPRCTPTGHPGTIEDDTPWNPSGKLKLNHGHRPNPPPK